MNWGPHRYEPDPMSPTQDLPMQIEIVLILRDTGSRKLYISQHVLPAPERPSPEAERPEMGSVGRLSRLCV